MPLQQTSGNDTADAYGGGVAVEPNYIESVFSTYLYTGNGSTQTIANGIDLSGKGGMVWQKIRSSTGSHILVDTARGPGYFLNSNTSNAQTYNSSVVSSFNSDGFTDGGSQASGATYASWTFRKQPKFFDVVTYTGDGTTARNIAHALGSTPGFVVVKRTDASSNWPCFHKQTYNSLALNLTAVAGPTAWTGGVIYDCSSTTFSVSDYSGSVSAVNASGATYVAYLFAHNAGGFGLTGTDNVISCGSYSGTSSSGKTINVGFEPQLVLIKRAVGGTGDWVMLDTMRGFSNNQNTGAIRQLLSNTSGAESNGTGTGPFLYPTATGFTVDSTSYQYNSSGSTYIYIAIRRGPMKVPTTATQVFAPSARAGNGSSGTSTAFGNVTDLTIIKQRGGTNNWAWTDRLRSATYEINSAATTAETQLPNDVTGFDVMAGFSFNTGSNVNASGSNYIDYLFQRAPSFFDEVCYTSDGTYNPINHNLTVVPELVIQKIRDGSGAWYVYNGTQYGYLNTTAAFANFSRTLTATTFVPITQSGGNTFVTYLFASCPGVSKVGSYTGNGSTQTINCSFTGGARFVLIKRTDSTGDWYVYDTARGMTTLTDPYLLLNSTAAESATLGSVTTVSTGFAVDASILAAINTNAASYIFLAIA